MFKEVNGITTLGLKIGDKTGENLFQDVWDTYYSTRIDDSTYKGIMNSTYDCNYRTIDKDTLEKLIGVYPITCEIPPVWKEEFVLLVDRWIYKQWEVMNNCSIAKDFIKPETKELPVKTMDERNSHPIPILKRNLYDALFCANYSKGMIMDGKRETKILKYIKSKLSSCFAVTDKEYEDFDWYKFYMKHKESSKPLYLIITNSLASQLGMSSYAPVKDDKEDKRTWSSCQTIHYNSDGYARCLLSSCQDQGALVMYVTDGIYVPFVGLDNYMHQQMYCRWMLRLLEKGAERFVAIDRAYPNDMYSSAAFDILIRLCDSLDIKFGLYSGYNGSQGSCNFITDSITEYSKRDTAVKSAYWIPATFTKKCGYKCEGCDRYQVRMCGDCEHEEDTCNDCGLDDLHHCMNCEDFNAHRCETRNCRDCTNAPCRNNDDDDETSYTHYDDQTGNNHLNSASEEDDDNYKYQYFIYDIDTKAYISQDKPKRIYATGEFVVGARVIVIRSYDSARAGLTGILVVPENGGRRWGVRFDISHDYMHDLDGRVPRRQGYWVDRDCLMLLQKDEEQTA